MSLFVAEVKTISPFGLQQKHSWEQLLELACEAGDWVAVHTNPQWGGSFDKLAVARKSTNKMLLAKGLHQTDDEIRRALDCGADAVLVVGRVPAEGLISSCWLEPNSLAELTGLPRDFNYTVVWNARDLTTGLPKTETWEQARKLCSTQMCQASFIKQLSDVHHNANYFLVGEHLVTVAGQFLAMKQPKHHNETNPSNHQA